MSVLNPNSPADPTGTRSADVANNRARGCRVVAAITDDGNAEAVVELARRLGDRRPLAVHVQEPPPLAGMVPAAGVPLPPRVFNAEDRAAELEAVRAEGHRLLDRLDLGAIEPASVIGRPAATIADLARRNAATAIVTGSRGRGGLRAAVLGSVSRELVGIAPCPVIVTDTSRTEGYGPVIAGIPDDHDDAAVVERHARQLAETLQRPLLLVEADGSGPPSGGATAAIEAAGDAVWRLAPPGRPAEALRRAAHNVDAALVVVGSRTGALGAFIGASTSAELGRTLRRPLAVIPLRALDDDDDRAA